MKQHKANDAEVLFPEVEMLINDEKIIVREFTFIQGMKVNTLARPFIESLSTFFNDNEPEFSAMSLVFEQHLETLIELMSISINKPTDWFSTLSDTDGQSLLMAFWSVNKAFFINRLLMKGMTQQA